ncbi:MAG: hypothetical protein NTW83_02650 [Cyanobacteria bacterium]|nr:hypothetical protein [Cyanobacteriota bacterium]
MPTDLAALTHLCWCLGVRSRGALQALRSCSNPQLRTRIENDLLQLRLQANTPAAMAIRWRRRWIRCTGSWRCCVS